MPDFKEVKIPEGDLIEVKNGELVVQVSRTYYRLWFWIGVVAISRRRPREP